MANGKIAIDFISTDQQVAASFIKAYPLTIQSVEGADWRQVSRSRVDRLPNSRCSMERLFPYGIAYYPLATSGASIHIVNPGASIYIIIPGASIHIITPGASIHICSLPLKPNKSTSCIGRVMDYIHYFWFQQPYFYQKMSRDLDFRSSFSFQQVPRCSSIEFKCFRKEVSVLWEHIYAAEANRSRGSYWKLWEPSTLFSHWVLMRLLNIGLNGSVKILAGQA